MHIEVAASRTLWFDDGTPVRAASGVAPFGGGWLVVQDDGTHAAWCRPAGVQRIRLFPPVQGFDTFSPADGTKALKPDLEAAVAVVLDGVPGVVALGSGSSPRRMRGALVVAAGPDDASGASAEPTVHTADLSVVYRAVADRLGIDPAEVNLEGACAIDGVLRWFNRGNLAGGVPSASVDVELDALLATFTGRATAADVAASLGTVRTYDLGAVDGVGLTVTDAVVLGGGRVLVSAAAEDTPNAIDDGPVVGAALAVLDGATVVASAMVPLVEGRVQKVEGLAVLEQSDDGATVLAVVDDDDVERPSAEHRFTVRWR